MKHEFKQVGVYVGWGFIIVGLVVLVMWSGYVFPDVTRKMEQVTSYFYDSEYAEPGGFFSEIEGEVAPGVIRE